MTQGLTTACVLFPTHSAILPTTLNILKFRTLYIWLQKGLDSDDPV